MVLGKIKEEQTFECPECGSKRTIRSMLYKTKKWGEQPRRKCKDCCSTFYENEDCRTERDKKKRDDKIREKYIDGTSIPELATEYFMTERNIYRIIKENTNE